MFCQYPARTCAVENHAPCSPRSFRQRMAGPNACWDLGALNPNWLLRLIYPVSFHEILVKSRSPLYIEYNPRTNQQATGVLNTAHLGSCWILLKSEVSLNMFNPMNLVTTFAIHCLVIIQIKIAYSNLRWLVLKCTKHILNNLWSLVRLQFWSISIGSHYLFKMAVSQDLQGAVASLDLRRPVSIAGENWG